MLKVSLSLAAVAAMFLNIDLPEDRNKLDRLNDTARRPIPGADTKMMMLIV